MGVYLSAPITEKVSDDKTCKNFVYGASSMQGWRKTQEDAHNCCPDFDPEKNGSLFAVYDGHGGAEVALYAALHLPNFIKSLKSYQDGDYRQALEEAFLRFDATLVEDKVIEELKALAGEDPGEEDEGAPEAVGRREADMLCAEANMPLDELLAKYEPSPGVPFSVRDVRKKENVLSPVVPNKHTGTFFKGDDCTPDSSGGNRNNSNVVNFSGSIVTSLLGKLSNGHAENENNLNTEKEMQNNQNPNWDAEKAETSSSNIAESSSVKDESRLEGELPDSNVADSSTSQMDQKHSSKGPSVSSSSSSSSSSVKDFVSSTIEQGSSSSREAHCQSSGDVPSANNSVQNNSCSQSGSSKAKSGAAGTDRMEESGEPPGSSDCPSSSSDIPKNSHVKADSSGNKSKAGREMDAESSTEKADEPSGSRGRGDEPATGSGGGSGPSSSEAQQELAGGSGDQPDCSGQGSGTAKPEALGGSGDQPGGSGGSSADQPGGSGCSMDGPGSSSIEDEEPGGSGSGAGGSVKTLTDRPDLMTGDDSDDSDDNDDEDDDEYQEDSEDDYEDEDEEEEEEEDGELEGSGFHPCVDMTNEEPGSDSGCTACLALLLGKDLWVANAGDSRCVLSRAGKAVEMSFDHKPEDDIERTRIEKAGGKITSDGRVNGGLNLSRALGDHYYKRNEELPAEEQMITALPDIEHVTLSDEDEFVVIACDGIWNYMSSDDVISMVRQELKDPEKLKKPSLICEKMFNHCLAPNTFGDGTGCDNMTCIIIVLKPSTAEPNKRCAAEMDSCSSTEEGVAEKRTKLESDSSTSCMDDAV